MNTRLRRGLTIIELLITLGIVVSLAAITIALVNPGAESDMDRARLAAAELVELREAINGFEVTLTPTSFKQNVGKNPIRLSDLTNKISSTAGQPNSVNSCGGTYLSTEVTNWALRGPYWDGLVTSGLVQLAPGFVAQDLMVATKVSPSQFTGLTNMGQTLAIILPSVTITDARNLAELVDGDPNGTGVSSTVRFTASGAASIPVSYIVLINNC